jgi:hypothetical protein
MLNKHNLEIAELASKDESRFTLNAIYVTPEATVETDGHQLVMVTTPDIDAESFPATPGVTPTKKFKPFLLDAETALKIAKAIPRKTTLPVLACVAIGSESDKEPPKAAKGEDQQPGTAVLAVNNLESPQVFQPKKMKGNFPDYERVIPKPGSEFFQVGFDLNILVPVLERFQKFLKPDRNIKPPAPVSFQFQQPTEGSSGAINHNALRLDAENDGQKMTAVVMPLRHGDDAANHRLIRLLTPDRSLAIEAALDDKPVASDQPVNGHAMPDTTALPDHRALASKVLENLEAYINERIEFPLGLSNDMPLQERLTSLLREELG